MLPIPLETTGYFSAQTHNRVFGLFCFVFSWTVFISMPSYYKQAIMCEFFPINIHLDNNSEETAPKRRPWHSLLSWAAHSGPSFESKARAMPKVRGTLVSACSFLLRDVGNKGKERPRRRRQCKNYPRGMQTKTRGVAAASALFPMCCWKKALVCTAGCTVSGRKTLRTASVKEQLLDRTTEQRLPGKVPASKASEGSAPS